MIAKQVAEDEGVKVEEEGGFWGMDNCCRMMQKLPFSAAIICCTMIVSNLDVFKNIRFTLDN